MLPAPVMTDSQSTSLWHESFSTDGSCNHYCRKFGPAGYVMPSGFEEAANSILNFDVRPDDVWVITFPKSGTTWMQEMAWLIANKLDLKAAEEKLTTRFPYFEKSITIKDPTRTQLDNALDNSSMGKINRSRSPRFIKTHLHFEFLPTQIHSVKPKVIYVARNVKDVIVSYFHHFRLYRGYEGTLDECVDAFISGNSIYAPCWKHITVYWEKRNDSNFLFTTYEEMIKDLGGVIVKIAKFLDVNLTDAEIDTLVVHLKFEQMKKNSAVNKNEKTPVGPWHKEGLAFMRKGILGSGNEELSTSALKKLDDWISENKIDGLHDEYC